MIPCSTPVVVGVQLDGMPTPVGLQVHAWDDMGRPMILIPGTERLVPATILTEYFEGRHQFLGVGQDGSVWTPRFPEGQDIVVGNDGEGQAPE